MRLRNVPGSRETLAKSSYCFETPEELKGRWQEEFGNQNPVYIEIGMGKGKFITPALPGADDTFRQKSSPSPRS